MKGRRFNKRTAPRKSVFCGPGRAGDFFIGTHLSANAEGMYPHMLIEDASIRIMPIGGQSNREDFSVRISPKSDPFEEALANCIARRQWPETLASAVCDFFHDAMRRAMYFGHAPYELVPDQEDSEETPGLFLVDIYPASFVKALGRPHQVIPKRMAKELGRSRLVALDPENTFVFGLPKKYGSERMLTLFQLRRLSKDLLPKFGIEAASRASNVPFSLEEFYRTQRMALGKAALPYGWDGRRLLDDATVEFYQLERFLSFQRFLAECRAGFLFELNRIAQRVGGALGFEGRVDVLGLPTVEDVNEALSRLRSGSCAFGDVLKPFVD